MFGFDHPWLFGVSVSLAALAAIGFAILAQQGPRLGDVGAEPPAWDVSGALALALALLAWQLLQLPALPSPERLASAAVLLVGGSLLALRLRRHAGIGAGLGAAAALFGAALVLPVVAGSLRPAELLGPPRSEALIATVLGALVLALAGMQAVRAPSRWRRLGTAGAGLLLLAALLAWQTVWLPSWYDGSAMAAVRARLPVALPLALLSLLLLAGRQQDATHARLRELRLSGLKQRQLLLAGDAERLLRENANCARQAEARLDLLLGGAGVGAFDWDLITGSVRFSERWATMLGHEPQQIEQHRDTWARLVHPADFERLQQELALYLAGDRPQLVCELRLRNAQQAWQWVQLNAQVVERSAEGRPRRLVGTQTDIDEVKRERLARRAERRLFTGGPVQRVVTDSQPPFTLCQGIGAMTPATGEPASATTARALADWVHGDDLPGLVAAAEQARAQPGQPLHCELRLMQSDGSWRWVLLHAVVDPPGEHDPDLLRGYLVDIDGLKQAQAAASSQGEDLRALVAKMSATQRFLEGLQEMTEQLQLCDSADAGRALIARAGQALFPGWDGALAFVDGDGLLALDVRWGGFPAPAGRLGSADCWALKLGRSHHVQRKRSAEGDAGLVPVCGHFGGGQALPAELTHTLCVPLAAEPGHEPAGALQLLTRQPLGEAELRIALWGAESFAHALRLSLANLSLRLSLRDQAVRDWLTGLYNRRHFDEALRQELRRAARGNDNLVLALLDIDHFKAFNDTFGHTAGDAVIRAVAAELHGFVRSYDIAARVGGEELAVLLPRAHLEETCARLDQLRERVAALELGYEGVVLPGITVSIGVADIAHGPVDNLMERADQAMYMSKHLGRNRLTSWKPDLPTVSQLALLDERLQQDQSAAEPAHDPA